GEGEAGTQGHARGIAAKVQARAEVAVNGKQRVWNHPAGKSRGGDIAADANLNKGTGRRCRRSGRSLGFERQNSSLTLGIHLYVAGGILQEGEAKALRLGRPPRQAKPATATASRRRASS